MEKYEFSPEHRSLMEQLQVPFAIYQFIDKRVVTLILSAGFCETFGYTDRALAYYDMDHDMYKDAHPDDVARIADAAYRFATEGGTYEVVYRTKDYTHSEYRIIHAQGKHIYTDTGVRLAQVWYTDEGKYTETETSDHDAFHQALHHVLRQESDYKSRQYDYMTGLPSMAYFLELAEAGKQAIRRDGGQAVMLYLDLCGMKYFNFRHGFAEGDRLIQAVAKTLIRFFSSENCCHVGADHFMAYTREEGLEAILQQLFYECSILNGGDSLPVRVGIYPARLEDVPAQVAIDRAKIACDARRRTFESGWSYYNKSMTEDAERRQYILSNLDRAIAEGWIQVYYQPIVRAVTGRVCDEEALARWIDPVKGFLSPAQFIPFLEDAGQIYKLDLYVLDQVLEKMHRLKEAGLYVVPHSVNLSRSDFEVCDIVEEIRRRVDQSGISRSKITIEITESVIGSDFDFMQEQIARFQGLGFPVWMDDFGSGYSSLDVLQSIKFDLLKFDMSFMRKLDEGENGKIILTELMKMAGALGVDTICEGVETEAQVRFLREIGCSKFQGYYFCKPVSLEMILERYRKGIQIGFENPAEAAYNEAVSRINLFDLSFLANRDDSVIKNTFDTVPMGIMEVSGDKKTARYVRSNQSYRDFMKRAFGFDLSNTEQEYQIPREGPGSAFMKAIEQSKENGNRSFIDEALEDGAVAHSFARRIAENPVTGRESVAVAVLSITEPDANPTYADIASALAADYYNIYVIDLDTNEYLEYTSRVGDEDMALKRHGGDFFESACRDTMTRIYEADRASFLALFTKENVLSTLDKQGVFTTTYRLMDTGKPIYVNMKVNRMRGGNRLILGVSVVDSQVRQKRSYEELQQERGMLIRVMALSDGYLTLFTVDPKTGHYVEYSSSEDFDSLGAASDGTDFFGQAYVDAFTYCYAPDRERFQEQVTMKNVLREIQQNGSFRIDYHLIIKGVPRPVTLKAALFKDGDEEKLVVGVRARKEQQQSDAAPSDGE